MHAHSFQAEGGLEEVEVQLDAMGLPYKKQTIEENGVRVTQVCLCLKVVGKF